MKMLVTDAAKEKIAKNIKGPAKLLLSLDDGVGDYSDEGSCSMETSFDVIAVDPKLPTKDYDGVITTNIGNFYYKGYSKMYFDESGLKLDVKFNQLALSSDDGAIDSGIPLLDKR